MASQYVSTLWELEKLLGNRFSDHILKARKRTAKNGRNSTEFLNSLDLGKDWPPLLSMLCPPPSGAACSRTGPQWETPKVPNEKITKLDRANDNIQEKIICSIRQRFQRPKPCHTAGRSTRRDTKHNMCPYQAVRHSPRWTTKREADSPRLKQQSCTKSIINTMKMFDS